MTSTPDPSPQACRGPVPSASTWIFAGLVLVGIAGAVAFRALRPSSSPPPAAIAADPLLVRGREVFLDRCATCHGQGGAGDGPIAKNLAGPPVGNLTDADWKHGDAPGQVLGVIRLGVKETQMPAWGVYLPAADVKAVAGYVYHLAGREVPGPIRAD